MRSAKSRRRSQRAGIVAEYLSLALLILKGYWPLAWRFKTPVGEIDLIVKRGRTLVFVEVKHRRNRDDAAYAVHAKNQSRVLRAAQYFLQARPSLAACQVRFDVCLVPWYRLPHHITQAFEAS
jgi:putative endonuclease